MFLCYYETYSCRGSDITGLQRRPGGQARIMSSDTVNRHEHILVCLSPAPSNANIVKTGGSLARAFHADLTALYVKTPDSDKMNDADKKRLQKNIDLAGSLGAEIVTVYGDDIPGQIVEYARISNITKIILGRSNVSRRHFWSRPPLTEQLINAAPDIDIYIIPDSAGENRYQSGAGDIFSQSIIPTWKDVLITAALFGAATLIGFLFESLGFTEANIITVYILFVLITALYASGYLCCVASSLLSVLAFNFFFTEPRFTFHAYEQGYAVTFAIMLIVSLVIGTLAGRLKIQARQSSQAAWRTQILLDTGKILEKAHNEDEIFLITKDQLSKLLERDIIVDKADDKKGPASAARAFPIGIDGQIFGEVSVDVSQKPLEPFDESMIQSILAESALAIENRRNEEEKEEAALLAKNEQLRADMLRSISHDLRTPLTSISGNTENLLSNGDALDEAARKEILTDIYDDSQWLISLVENLLSITRIEDGRMKISTSPQIVDDVLEEALKHSSLKYTDHYIKKETDGNMIVAQMDSRMIIRVIINLIDNAIKYTPAGSTITVKTKESEGMAYISVIDDGPGIPDEEKSRVFDMFYIGDSKVPDGRRSLGIGLALCRTIVQAHGGELTLNDAVPTGCNFTFTLPESEVGVHV